MPSSEELRALEARIVAETAAPAAPPAEPTLELTRGAERVSVPKSERFDYLAQGYADPRYAEGATSERELTGVDSVLARGEALDRGATFGAGGLLGSLGSGIAAELSGYQGPRAAAPGIDGALSDKSEFRQGFEDADLARKERAEGLGVEGLAWEAAGGLAAGLATGGASLGAKALAMAPAAAAERLGGRVAAKLIGDEAAATALTYVGARAAGALAEGAASSLAGTAAENVSTALENPGEAAENVAMGTLFGAGISSVLGGGFGLVEGVSRAANRAIAPAIEAAVAPVPAVPAQRAIEAADAIQEGLTRPMRAAELPDPVRSTARTLLDQHRALTGGTEEVLEEGTRAVRGGLDRFEQIKDELRVEAGISQKKAVNDAALRLGLADQLTDVVDEVDTNRLAELAATVDSYRASTGEAEAALTALRDRAAAATAAEAAARNALDGAGAPGIALNTIVNVPKLSKDFPGGVRVDTFELPGKGSVRIDSGETPGYATISQIQVDPAMTRQGIGSSLYAKADEYARSKGLKLASDTQRSPTAESWWKKQVAAGRAEYSAEMDRFVLNQPLAPKGKPDARAMRPMREALKTSTREAKLAAKELARAEAEFGARRGGLEAAERALAENANVVPRNLTKAEVESRGMFDGLIGSIEKFAARSTDKNLGAANQLLMTVKNYRDLAYDFMRRGDYGEAYHIMDQGLKGALSDAVNSARTGAVETLAKELHAVPRSFLENRAVWADVADTQALVNGKWSPAIQAANNAHYKAMFADEGIAGADGWESRQASRSATVRAMMGGLGTSGTESTEEGVRRALRLGTDDVNTRVNAWGATPRGLELAREAARVSTHVEDTMDRAALAIRDRAVGGDRLAAGTALSTVAAMTAGAAGMPGVAVGAIGARWLLGSLAKYKGDLLQRVVSGTTRFLAASEKLGARVGKMSARGPGQMISRAQREEALKESRELTDIRSPRLAALAREAEMTNAVSPGLGDAMLQQKLVQAEYIQSKLPKPPSPAVFSPPPTLSVAAANQLDRIILATQSPGKTFDRILDGAATPEDLDAMRKLHPQAYQTMTNHLLETVKKNPAKVRSVHARMYLSRVVGQPLTPALMRLASSQARAKAATQSAEDAGRPQGPGANGSDGKTARAEMSIDPDDLYGSRADAVMTR